MNSAKTQALSIYNLCIDLQRTNKVIGTLYDTGLTLSESQILIELDLDPIIDISSLAKKLALNQSSISRAVQKLAKNKLITIIKNKEDQRKLILKIKPLGLQTINKIDQAANKILEDLSQNISRTELNDLILKLTSLLDHLGINSALSRPEEHPFRPVQRRIARLIKILSNDLDLTLTEHHILKLLNDQISALTPSEIANALGLKTSAVSISLKSLKKLNLIKSISRRADARFEDISITNLGNSKLINCQSKQVKPLINIIEKTEDQEQLILLFKKFLINPNYTLKKFKERFSVRILNTVSLRSQARIAFIKDCLKKNDLEKIPEKIFDIDSKCFGLFEKSNLVAAIQFNAEQQISCEYSNFTNEEYKFLEFFKQLCI